jgi:hypothetical protein
MKESRWIVSWYEYDEQRRCSIKQNKNALYDKCSFSWMDVTEAL